ncbi:MAG: hydrogen peroxide-inducible genes activator [Pseudomonadota bacterium]
MRPTLKQMQYLVAIAETGKFGSAAKLRHVSQPSLSAQIAEMESELGTTLIERGRLGAILTPAGQDAVRRSRDILRSVEDMKSSLKPDAASFSGRLRLGVIPSVGPYLLPSVARKLHSKFPDFRINVQEERTIDLDRHLRDGRLDTIISTEEDHANVRSQFLFNEHLWICVASDHPLAESSDPLPLKQMEGQSLLSLGLGHNLNLTIRELARISGAFVNSEYEGTSLDAIRQMAEMGAGIAVLPSLYALIEARRDQALVVRRIEHSAAQRDIALIWRDTSPYGSQMRELAEIIKTVADKLLKGHDKR